MLIVSGTSQAQVFSRDGEPGDNRGTQYMKGDPYIRDMKHTSSVVSLPVACLSLEDQLQAHREPSR